MSNDKDWEEFRDSLPAEADMSAVKYGWDAAKKNDKYFKEMADLADEVIYNLKGYMEQVYGPQMSKGDFDKWHMYWVKFCEIKESKKGEM